MACRRSTERNDYPPSIELGRYIGAMPNRLCRAVISSPGRGQYAGEVTGVDAIRASYAWLYPRNLTFATKSI